MHAAQNGVGVDPAWAMNNLRIMTYVVSLLLLGVHAIGVGLAARADGFSPRLVGAGGLLVGACLLTAPLLLAAGLHDLATLLWSLCSASASRRCRTTCPGSSPSCRCGTGPRRRCAPRGL